MENKKKWLKEQNSLKKSRTEIFPFKKIDYVCGVDISFLKNTDIAVVSTVLLDYLDMTVVCEAFEQIQITEPYISGFLAFREVSPIMSCFSKMCLMTNKRPQVILVDGSGLLHPNEFGLACHLGVLLDIPTIGVAKKFLHVDGLTKDKVKKDLKIGSNLIIGLSGKIWGSVYSVSPSNNPIYISVGNKINLEKAVEIVEKCLIYRIPEPIRQADIKSREWIRVNIKQP